MLYKNIYPMSPIDRDDPEWTDAIVNLALSTKARVRRCLDDRDGPWVDAPFGEARWDQYDYRPRPSDETLVAYQYPRPGDQWRRETVSRCRVSESPVIYTVTNTPDGLCLMDCGAIWSSSLFGTVSELGHFELVHRGEPLFGQRYDRDDGAVAVVVDSENGLMVKAKWADGSVAHRPLCDLDLPGWVYRAGHPRRRSLRWFTVAEFNEFALRNPIVLLRWKGRECLAFPSVDGGTVLITGGRNVGADNFRVEYEGIEYRTATQDWQPLGVME